MLGPEISELDPDKSGATLGGADVGERLVSDHQPPVHTDELAAIADGVWHRWNLSGHKDTWNEREVGVQRRFQVSLTTAVYASWVVLTSGGLGRSCTSIPCR